MAKSQEEIYEQVYGTTSSKKKEQGNNLITRSSEKLDDGVKSVEDRVYYWQDMINNWRITIMQNEQLIVSFCILWGLIFAYAINECTGNLNFPWYVYGLVVIIMVLCSLLLIADGSLPLVVILKFVSSFTVGHASMMILIAIDGHTWGLFTTDVCRYPVTTDAIMWIILGGSGGWILKSYEEIRLKRDA